MSRFYEEPIIELRKYGISQNVFTESHPEQGGNLDDDDIIDPGDDPFAD